MNRYVREFADAIQKKPRISQRDFQKFQVPNVRIDLFLTGRLVPVARMTAEETAILKLAPPLSIRAESPHYQFGHPDPQPVQDQIDRRPFQTSVRDQLDRNTCASFAVLAAMEARLNVQGIDLDLSEQ